MRETGAVVNEVAAAIIMPIRVMLIEQGLEGKIQSRGYS